MRSGDSTSSSVRTRAAVTWSSGATRLDADAGSTCSATPSPTAGRESTVWVRPRPEARRSAAEQTPVRRPYRPHRAAELRFQRPRVRRLQGRYPGLGPPCERSPAGGPQLQVPQAPRYSRGGRRGPERARSARLGGPNASQLPGDADRAVRRARSGERQRLAVGGLRPAGR